MKKLTFIIIIGILFSLNADAQDTTGIPSENVEVIKNYEASIAQASKKTSPVQLRKNEYAPINFSYSSSIPKAIDFDRPEPVIRAIAYDNKQQTEDIKDGSIYGAYGNYTTIKAGAAYHYYIEDWIEAGLNIKHFSAKDSDFPAQKYKQSSGQVYTGFYFNPNTKIRGTVFGDFSRHYTQLDSSLRNNPYDRTGVKLDFSHVAFEKLGLSIRSSAGFDKIKQATDLVNENTLYGSINIYKRISDNVALELPFKYATNKVETETELVLLERFNELTFDPQLDIKTEKFLLSAGVQFLKGFNRTIVFPNIDFKLSNIFSDFDLGISVFADIDRASPVILSQENPFASSKVINNHYGSYRYIQNYQLGLGRNFGVHQLQLTINYRRLENEFQYQYSAGNFGYSTVLVDRNEIQFAMDYDIKLKSKFTVSAAMQYNHFIDKTQASYVPKWTGTLHLNKQFGNKVDIGLSLLAFAKREFSFGDDILQSVPANADLAFNFKYRISKTFSIFAESSNLLASENYMLWHPQAVLQRQIWGGIQFNF